MQVSSLVLLPSVFVVGCSRIVKNLMRPSGSRNSAAPPFLE